MDNLKRRFARLLLLLFLFNITAPLSKALAKPAIVISVPSDYTVVTTGFVDVAGYVTDSAILTVNGTSVYPGSNGFFSHRVSNLASGSNQIRIVAVSSTGAQVARVLNVIYDSSAVVPAISISNPAALNSEVVEDALVISGTVTDFDTLEAVFNGSPANPADITLNPDGTFTYPVTLAAGDNTILFTARKGDVQSSTTLFIRYNDQGVGMPNIYNLLPSGGTVSSNSVTVTGSVANTPVNGLTVNGTVVSFNSVTGNFSKSVTLSSGVNTVTVRVTNGVNIVTKTINLVYQANPIISLTSPSDQQVVTRGSITITGKVFNTNSSGLYINNELVPFNSSDGSFSKTISLRNIRNNIEIRAYNGSLVTSKNLTVYYDLTPSAAVTSHTSGQSVDTGSVILEGTVTPYNASEISAVTINGTYTATVANGTFRSEPIALQAGDNALDITVQTNPTGPIGAKTQTKPFRLVCLGLPAITVTSPIDGATVYTNSVTVRGQLEHEDFVSLKVGGKDTTIDSDGGFRQTVTLQEGENKIDIEAVYGGNTIKKTITVYYNSVISKGAKVTLEVEDSDEIKAFEDTIKIKLAKGSLGLTTTASVSVEDPDDLDEDLPRQSSMLGPLYRLEWGNYRPAKPYKMTLKYDDVVRENQVHKVSVFHYDEGDDEWRILGGVVDAKAGTISIGTDREGYFCAVMYFRTFDDVNSHWAQKDIEYLVAQGAVTGTGGSFTPDGLVTRAEFVTFLVRGLGWQTYEPERSSYSDVSKKHWAFSYIETALRAGLISGVSHNRFAPERYITREEAGVLLARAGNLKGVKEQELTKIFSPFGDAQNISRWARLELAAAIKAKVLSGSANGMLLPQNYATRAQAAAMITRLTETIKKSR